MKMKQPEKQRLRRVIGGTLLALGIGGAYAGFVRYTDKGIPCLFHRLTGRLCPGCGISRMFLALWRGDIVSAARYNLFVLCMLPFAAVLYVHKTRQYVKTGQTHLTMVEKIAFLIVFVLCIVFSILRNTDVYPFLIMPQ